MIEILSLGGKAFGAFGAGLLASISPCVYPLIPITVGFLGANSGQSQKKRLLFFALGQMLTFVALGFLSVELGETFGFSSETQTVQIGVGLILIVAGTLSYMGRLPGFLTKWNQFSGKLSNVKGGSSFISAIAIGAASALVASPCSSPILAGVLALMASNTTLTQGSILMALYGVGFSFLFILIGLGLTRISQLPRAGYWLNRVHQFSSALLFGVGIFFLVRGIWFNSGAI